MRISPIRNLSFLGQAPISTTKSDVIPLKTEVKTDTFEKEKQEEKTESQKAYEKEKQEKELAFKKRIQEPGKFSKKESK